VPEPAARDHLERLPHLLNVALDGAGVRPSDVDLVAVTRGPGLAGCLLVGVGVAEGLGVRIERLAELFRADVNLPKGFTVTVEAFRRHWEQAGLAEFADAALSGLGPGRLDLRETGIRSFMPYLLPRTSFAR